ncbi:MAG TPA: ParB/Srx family N-terminal domain-containing protein, partial [Sphingobium sp.]|uniref:ParB/RepB/Spo0J family partition protein n=1 Tax=Sphingobium sp. TaxID=1912891 RepID=UPI002ED49FF8
MNLPIIYVPARHCAVSPLNVRTQTDEQADAELEAMIGQAGYVLQNLIGTAEKRKKDRYAIFGGGRRLARVHALIDKGTLPETFEVPVMVMPSTKDAIEVSLAENQKLPMSAADECVAYRQMVDKEGKTPAQIAIRFGKTERFVLGRLRLANLAEPVFAALRAGEITLDVAAAYGSISDTARQASVFDQLSGSYHATNVNEIRRMLSSGTYRGSDPKALFVGREAYEAEQGRIESDLFSSAETEIWLDADIVDRLAEEKLVVAAAALREREGFAEVRTVPALQVPYMETYDLETLIGEPAPLTEEAAVRKAAIETELSAIETDAEENDGYSEDQAERVEALEDELGLLVDTGVLLSDEQRSSAIAYLVIGRDGEARLHEALFVQPPADEAEDPDGADSLSEDGAGDAEVDEGDSAADEDEEDEGIRYSLRLSDELAMMKTEILALHIASDPHFAVDLGTFIMVDNAMWKRGYSGMPSDLRASVPSPRVVGFESGTPAAEAWAKLDADLDGSWVDHNRREDRYDAFCALSDEARAAWLGWAIARTLHAVPAGGTGESFLNHLGAKL